MKVSFVIPAYNEEKNIGKCVDSVLRAIKASACDAEVVVINNASADRTAEIASSRPGVRVVDEPRKGLLYARQKGLEASTGELLACVDADTLMSARWIAVALRAFSRSPRMVCLSGPYLYFDLSSATNVVVAVWYLLAMLSMHAIGQYVLRSTAMLQGGNYIVRRTALEKIGGYNTSISFYGEDTDLACRLIRVGTVRFTPRLTIAASGRRIRKEGFVATGFHYATNGLAVALRGKPVTRHHTDIRDA